MNLTRAAFGIWCGGRFQRLGEEHSEERFIGVIQHAYQQGVRTFMTADVYGCGAADGMLGRALAGLPRDSYCLVGAVGHDIYSGRPEDSKSIPRFTNPQLRQPKQFAAYLRMAAEKSLERCQADRFDCLLLHNPDSLGFGHDAVWAGMEKLREAKLTEFLGLSPGPANGFTLDLILCWERFGPLIDWAMIILNPLEPWPGLLCLPAAMHHDISIITRAVDGGGLFHDELKPGHKFGDGDNRAFRPAGWVEAGHAKLERMRDIARNRSLTMLQLACAWNLSHGPVQSVVPTLIQEAGANSKTIESQVDELASLAELKLSPDELAAITEAGQNNGGMELKGASRAHTGNPEADRWSLTPDLEAVGKRWGINPDQDLICTLGEA